MFVAALGLLGASLRRHGGSYERARGLVLVVSAGSIRHTQPLLVVAKRMVLAWCVALRKAQAMGMTLGGRRNDHGPAHVSI